MNKFFPVFVKYLQNISEGSVTLLMSDLKEDGKGSLHLSIMSSINFQVVFRSFFAFSYFWS